MRFISFFVSLTLVLAALAMDDLAGIPESTTTTQFDSLPQEMSNFVAVVGSLRKASYNRRVFNALEARIKKAGGSVTELDITGFPLFNQDLEADKFPKDVTKVKEAIVKADGLLIVSPEYNSGIPAVTKNFLDWCSRGEPSGTFKGKFIALASASPGGLGGRRMHMHMRDVIGMLGGHLHPNILGIPSVFKSVDGVDGPLNGDALEHADKFAVEIVAAAEHFNRPPASRKSSGKK